MAFLFWLLFSYFFSTALQVNYSILIWSKIKFHEFHILSTKTHIQIFPIIVLPTKKRACRIGKRVCLLVSWKGIEPPTYRLGGDRSILLSYQDVNVLLFSEPFYYNTNRESVQSQIFCHSRRHTPFHQYVRIEPKSCQANLL